MGCAQLLLHHIETGSIQTVGFISLTRQPGIGDMEKIIVIDFFSIRCFFSEITLFSGTNKSEYVND